MSKGNFGKPRGTFDCDLPNHSVDFCSHPMIIVSSLTKIVTEATVRALKKGYMSTPYGESAKYDIWGESFIH